MRAIASLRTNRAAIEADIGALVAGMSKSIAEADQFIKAMSEAQQAHRRIGPRPRVIAHD